MDTPWWRRPTDGWTRAGDVLRLLGLISAVGAPLWFGWVATPLFALVVAGLALLRLRDVPSSGDPAGGLVLLAAGWFAILDVYAHVPWLDLAVHAAAGGVVAYLALTIASIAGVLRERPRPPRAAGAVLAVAVSLGVALGYVWELLEWAGNTWVDPSIHIPYADTMTDIAACGVGAFVVGLLRLRADNHSPR